MSFMPPPAAGGSALAIDADVGFAVAPGDPDSLEGASARFRCAALCLEGHATTVQIAATSLAPSWRGQAASAYQALSNLITDHFRAAAETSRAAAAALRFYGAELDRCQRVGMQAVNEAERCQAEIRTQTSLRRAAALAGAQPEQQAATRRLAELRDELAEWQACGRRAWENAQAAADRATGSLAALRITPPSGVAPLPDGNPSRQRVTRGRAPNGRDGQGSGETIDSPQAGTIETISHSRSGETIKTITYTKSGETIETITYAAPAGHHVGGRGSGETIIG